MKISQQGDLDQTCFLYSIANAYRALTGHGVDDGRIQTHNGWSDIIKVTPSVSQFLTYGSDFYDSDSKEDQMIHKSIVRNAFEAFSSERYPFRTSKISIDEINCTDFMNSVVIFCITHEATCEYPHGLDEESSHWMVIVGRDEIDYFLACSCTRSNRGTGYQEHKMQSSGRLYNNKIPSKQLDVMNYIYSNYIYRVSCSKGNS